MMVLTIGSLAACGGKKGGNDAFEKTSAFADQMCACKDADCAKKVMDEMTKWSTEWAKNAKPDQVPDAEEQKKYVEVSKRMTDCSTKAMTPPK